jgi:hypothetical protein
MAAGPARFARNPGCRKRAGRAEIRYVIASAEHTGLKIANTPRWARKAVKTPGLACCRYSQPVVSPMALLYTSCNFSRI